MRLNPVLDVLQPYHSGPSLTSVMRRYGLDHMARLNANECPEGPFPEVVQALQQALTGLNRYPDAGADELRQALAERLGVPPSHLVFGNGSCEILTLLGQAVVTPGDTVVYADPSFVMYEVIVTLRGAVRAAVPLRGHAHDLEAMLAAAGPDAAMIIVCNPNNPTGTFIEPEPLRAFLAAVPSDTVVVLDEAYIEYVTAPTHRDSLPLLEEHENLVILRTFSKIYGLAGLRIGYGVANPALVAAMDKVRQPFNVTSLAQVAALEAIAHPGRVQARREHAASERARICAALDRMGIAYIPSEANFLMFSAEALAVPGPEVAQVLLEDGVLTRSGYAMGCPGWVRVTVGSVDENDLLLEGLGRLTTTQAGDSVGRPKEM